MNFEIALTFGILLVAVVLFVTEVVRLDLTALGVLVALALTGLVTTEQAIAGFSNPAVITVWAMYILSAGLAKTGVSSMIGFAERGLQTLRSRNAKWPSADRLLPSLFQLPIRDHRREAQYTAGSSRPKTCLDQLLHGATRPSRSRS
jgi:hypothetical protein